MFGHKGVAASVKYESVVSRDLEKQKRCQKLGIRLYEIPYFCHKTDAELVNYVSGLLKQTVAVDWGRFYDGLSILKVLRKIAKLHGGTMISNYYYGHECPVEWRCGLGHEWKASPSSVKNNGTWCPYCAWNRQKTIDDVKRIASVRGGECLSVNYTNNTEQLLWKCNNGHIWQASYTSIVDRGSWCPYCSKRAKMTLEEMQRIAADKGGKCLSGTYINRYTNLLWECGEGHRWEAQPAHIKFDTWCPYCNPGSKKVMPTIEEMMSLANLKGGACLSDKYVNAHTKLGWRCKNGHEWEASPTNIKSGKWCRKCCIEARKRK
jgi:hypothetical protein